MLNNFHIKNLIASLRGIAVAILRRLLRMCPYFALRRIGKKGYVSLLPDNVEFRYDKYLGNFRLNINTKYPIERACAANWL